jgi:hypothetical protein
MRWWIASITSGERRVLSVSPCPSASTQCRYIRSKSRVSRHSSILVKVFGERCNGDVVDGPRVVGFAAGTCQVSRDADRAADVWGRCGEPQVGVGALLVDRFVHQARAARRSQHRCCGHSSGAAVVWWWSTPLRRWCREQVVELDSRWCPRNHHRRRRRCTRQRPRRVRRWTPSRTDVDRMRSSPVVPLCCDAVG